MNRVLPVTIVAAVLAGGCHFIAPTVDTDQTPTTTWTVDYPVVAIPDGYRNWWTVDGGWTVEPVPVYPTVAP